MATWVRNGTGTAPTSTDAALTGTYELDNGTAPGDFDPSAVTSVQIAYTITGSGFAGDTWDDLRRAALTLNGAGAELAQIDGTDNTGLGNVGSNTDETDSTGIPTGNSTADWEGAEVNPASAGPYTTWTQDKGKDGGVQTMSALVVTITYTPDTGANVTPTAIAATATVPAPASISGAHTATALTPTATVPTPTVLAGGIIPALVVSDVVSANQQSYTIPSHTVSANKLLLLFVTSANNAGAANISTVTGHSLTWTFRNRSKWRPTDTRNVELWTAVVGGSDSTGTIVYDTGDASNIGGGYILIEVEGFDTGTPIVQTPINAGTAGTSGTVTLSAAGAAGNRPFSVFVHDANEVTTHRTNWSELSDDTDVGPTLGLESQWRADAFETTASATWSTSSDWGGIATEVKAAATGDANIAATAIAATATIGTLTASGGATVTATAIAATAVVPTPTVAGHVSITATAIAATAALDVPIASGSAVVNATAATATTTLPPPTVTSSVSISATAIAAVGVVNSGQYLSLPGSSGHTVTTPDHASLDITGDIDIRVRSSLDDWTPATTQALASKLLATGNQRSWKLAITPAGNVEFQWSTNGALPLITSTSSVATGIADGTPKWVRATLDVDNGASDADVTFYTSDDGVSWTQLGTVQNPGATTSIFSSSAQVEVGAGGNTSSLQNAAGNFYKSRIYDGIDGTLVADFDADDFALSDSDTDTAVDSTGKTWTINGASSVVEVTPQVSGGATVSATALTPTATVPTPTVTTGGNANVSATAMAATATVPAPSVSGGATVTATAVTPTATIDTPAVSVGVTISATAIAATATVPTPTVSGSATVSATALAPTATTPTPTVAGHVDIAATAIAATAVVGSPTVSGGAMVTATALAPTATIDTPTVTTSGDITVTPTAIAATATIPLPPAIGEPDSFQDLRISQFGMLDTW